MLRAAAHQLAAGLRSAELHERIERAQLGTAEALKAALEARAAAGPAEPPSSLAQLCEAVGARLGMDDDDLARCATRPRCTTSASWACRRRSSTSPAR